MKIFIDCRMLGSGGIGTYLESLLPYFTNENQTFLLINEKQKPFLAQVQDKAQIITTDIKTFSLKELFFFPKAILKIINSCDLYYSAYCNIPGGIKVPVYSTIHDIVFLDVPELSSKTGVLIRKFFYQRAINRSKVIFTVSAFSAERIRTQLKIKNKPLIVTYNSVPEHFTHDNMQKIEKDNSIIYVGNIKKHKGLAYLLQAYEICKKKGLDCKLVIIGNAENFRSTDTETAAMMANASLKGIYFSGRISDQELQQYYQKARLLVQPSLYEGFGMPPLEALSLGTSVIISDIPVFREIYEGFPVTFFKSQDSEDLAEKIIQNFDKPAPSEYPDKYSFKKTAEIIMNTWSTN